MDGDRCRRWMGGSLVPLFRQITAFLLGFGFLRSGQIGDHWGTEGTSAFPLELSSISFAMLVIGCIESHGPTSGTQLLVGADWLLSRLFFCLHLNFCAHAFFISFSPSLSSKIVHGHTLL